MLRPFSDHNVLERLRLELLDMSRLGNELLWLPSRLQC
jgi:hypothetical protein